MTFLDPKRKYSAKEMRAARANGIKWPSIVCTDDAEDKELFRGSHAQATAYAKKHGGVVGVLIWEAGEPEPNLFDIAA